MNERAKEKVSLSVSQHTNLVWVFGGSAVGKETFIRRMQTNPPRHIIEHLSWGNKKIVVIEESIEYIGMTSGDPLVKKRERIILKAKSVKNLTNSVILLKGQNVDLEMNLPIRLKREMPKARHGIVFLHASVSTLIHRCRDKNWWTEAHELAGEESFRKWLVNGQIKPLQNLIGFEKFALDSSNHDYTIIGFPPDRRLK